MRVAHLPEASRVRILRCALEHQRRGADRQRAVQHVAVSGDPAHVGCAPVDILVAIVEHVLKRVGSEHQVAAGGVQHAFGPAGGAGSVEDEQWILGAHFLERTCGRSPRHRLFIGYVAPFDDRHIGAGTPHDYHRGHRAIGAQRDRGIDISLQSDGLAAAQGLIGRNDDARAAVLDAAGDRLGRESGEDHRMDGADAGAGQHRHCGLRNHRQVDRDAIALAHAQLPQHVAEAADVGMQFSISDCSRLPGRSPSQMIAIRSPRSARCRSRQL